LLASLLRRDADDAELRDELRDSDFFLFFLPTDFSDAEELSLLTGETDRRIGEGGDCGSSCGLV